MNAPAVVVREVTIGDLDGLLGLYRQLVLGEDSEALPLGGREGARILQAAIEDPGRSLLVAERQGRLVGTLDQLVVANLTHQGRAWAVIENMVVDASARRQGVGSRLMAEALERARLADCYKVQLLSRKERTGAHAFYRSLGFEESAVGLRRYL